MATLDAAKQNKANFAKELDLNDDGKPDGETSATVNTAVTNDYNTKAGTVGATVSDAAGFAARSATVQDQMIADKQASLNTDLTKAVNKAEDGTAALLETVNEEIETANAAYEADAKATAAYSEEKGVFAGLNSNPTLGSGNGEWYFNGDKFGISDGSDGFQADKVYAEKVGGVWKLTADGTAASVKRIEDLAAKYEAAQAAAAAKTAAEGALADAVEAVYLNENGGDSAEATSLAAAISYNTGTETYEVDYTKLVDIYKTADDADAGAGTVQEFSFKVTAKGTANTDKVVFDGITYTSAGNESNADDEASAMQTFFNTKLGESGVTWAVVLNADGVTLEFTADAPADNVPTTFEITGAVAGSVQAGGEDGVAPGAVDNVDAPLSKAVNDAQTAIDGFDKAVAEFEAIRDIKGDLAELDQAITEATEWFADNDYAAPVILADTDSKNATNKSDVFLLSDLEGKESAEIGKFGDKGADYLFIGEGYTLVEEAITDINKKVGSTSELEIFWKQSGSDLVLYIEQEAYAGDLLNNDEIVEITLVGKTIDDITLDGSFITAGV